MAAAVDTAYLAASYAIPKETFDTIVDAPTVDLVRSLLDQLAAKARDFDQLKSDKLRADVELENAIRAGESRTRALKTSVDNSLKEIEELRKKLNDEENARVTVETELQNLKSSTTTSSSEKDALETRITTLEASNRDALALVESNSLHSSKRSPLSKRRTARLRTTLSASNSASSHSSRRWSFSRKTTSGSRRSLTRATPNTPNTARKRVHVFPSFNGIMRMQASGSNLSSVPKPLSVTNVPRSTRRRRKPS
ncbi:hypothetical protein BDY21DRAFT_167988 [Lineolata rhizophorae]|uniref:Uncharacterized protein n=1 Tax=Lineolata rhizophorae TaxID=578093 RepID=A0A6A6P9L4_9PEZI|nr:hypothetical protein BDY21DRAFT_167988 [Lineolata rhizophorae]